MDEIEWVVIKDITGREIGAVGFVSRKATVVVAFYDDRDANYDGEVSTLEWIAAKWSPLGIENKAVTEVAMAARDDPKVLRRDPSFNDQAMDMFFDFTRELLADGLYATYFSRGVASTSKSIAGRFTSDTVKQFAIRKGMEKAVKSVYDHSLRQ